MNSPIQLIDRKFTVISLSSQTAESDESEYDIGHLHAVRQDKEDPTHWQAKFGVRIANPENSRAHYVGEIVVVGTFTLAESFPQDKAEQMVYLNSGAILYGAIRELVISLTTQSIHGELVIPSIDARTFLPSKEDSSDDPPMTQQK